MTRYAIGDVQGCLEPLEALLRRVRFSADRDEVWFVGDLVNRGPQSLEVLRRVRALGEAAHTVLGNHDLHLLAVHHDPSRPPRDGDTFDEVLAAPDREALMDWLIHRPLLLDDAAHGDLFLHAGVVPDWTLAQALECAREASAALVRDPQGFLGTMYGNKPDRWRDAQSAADRHRFTINVLTRLRYCRADGTVNLKMKSAPDANQGDWRPWFEHAGSVLRHRRVVFGHWSTLGLVRRPRLLSLDTGCVWGGELTAVNLDDPEAPVTQVKCRACQQPGGD